MNKYEVFAYVGYVGAQYPGGADVKWTTSEVALSSCAATVEQAFRAKVNAMIDASDYCHEIVGLRAKLIA